MAPTTSEWVLMICIVLAGVWLIIANSPFFGVVSW